MFTRQKTRPNKILLRVFIVLILGIVLASPFEVMFSGKASANSGDGTFQYTDTNWSNINETVDGGTQVYHKSSGSTQGYYNGGSAQGFNGCTAIIHINSNKYDGSTQAQWYASCIGGPDITPNQPGKKTITVARPPSYVATWIDHSHLKVFDLATPNNSTIYYDNNIDNNDSYTATTQNNNCSSNIVNNFPGGGGDPANAGAAGKATITINHPVSSVNTNCVSSVFPISQFQQTQNYSDYFVWVDSGTIQTSDGSTMTFSQSGGSGTFIDSSGGACKSQIVPDASPGHGTLIIRYSGNNPFSEGFSPQITGADFSSNNGCQVSKPLHVNIANPTVNGKPANQLPPGSGTVIGGSGSGSTASKQLGCDIQLTNPLTWIVCPVVDTLVQIINFIDNLITDQLNIKTDAIFCNSDTCNAYYTAWKSFRDIALGLMAIAGLVIIISQALGMEILDAYTIRKAMPRLLIVAIAITLSWPLMQFLIQLSDDLGFGVRHLIYAPFSHLSENLDLSFGSGAVDAFFGTGTAAAGVLVGIPAWILLGGPAALLAYAGTAALAVLVAIVVLILRQVAIILLMLLAPVAIVAYILPNTQRVYRLWWESFSKALLMFPLIAAFIATGRVFSAIAIHNGGAINQLIGFMAYFAPYFMIPLTFKMAGSTMSGLGNFVQGRAQGGFQALSNLRGQQRKSRLERARGAGLYRKKTGLPGFLNKVGFYSLNADERIPYDLGSGTGLGRLTKPLDRGVSKLSRGKFQGPGAGLFGRMAGEMAGMKAGQLGEHIVKGVEQANMHYSTAWAALGFRQRLVGGLTSEGRTAMDERYGLDKDGKRSKETGLPAVTWQPPADTDYHGLLEYGQMLSKYGEDGSMAQIAGRQLDAGRVGTLTSFGRHMETQRATLQNVAMTSLAKDGKLIDINASGDEVEEALPVLNGMLDSKDPATRAFADTQLALVERYTQGARQDLRPGKGLRRDTNGHVYYVHGDKKVRERQKDGSYKEIEAYRTREAYDSSNSMKGQAALGAKAESIRGQAKTIIDMAEGKRPEILKPGEAEAMRAQVIAGSINSYSDPDSMNAWREIQAKLTPPSEAELAQAQREVDEQHRRQSGAGGGTPQPPGATPPAPPSGATPPPVMPG